MYKDGARCARALLGETVQEGLEALHVSLFPMSTWGRKKVENRVCRHIPVIPAFCSRMGGGDGRAAWKLEGQLGRRTLNNGRIKRDPSLGKLGGENRLLKIVHLCTAAWTCLHTHAHAHAIH